MSIFTDDNTGAARERAELARKSITDAGGMLIGAQAAEADKKKAQDSQSSQLALIMAQQAEQEKQLLALYEERDLIEQQLEELKQRRDHFSHIADDITDGNLPERGEDGKFVDKELEALIAAHEKKTGRSVDRADGGAILDIILAEQARIEEERKHKSDRLDEIERKIKDIKRELGEERTNAVETIHEDRKSRLSSLYDMSNDKTQEIGKFKLDHFGAA